MESPAEYPIQAVARMTGLTPHVIRIWERRYGAISPHRTASNRRLYTKEEIEKLRLLQRALQSGYAIGQIAGYANERLLRLLEESTATPRSSTAAPGEVDPQEAQEAMLIAIKTAVREMDAWRLEDLLERASVTFSHPVLLEGVLGPLLEWIGDEWREGALRVAHEHLATSVIRSFLGGLGRSPDLSETAPVLVVTTPAGQNHELGAMFAAVTAASEGWRVLYLGPNLPAEEITAAGRGARAVALSVTYPGDDPHLPEQLRQLRRSLPEGTALLVGGRASAAYGLTLEEISALRVTDMRSFRTQLERLRSI